MRQLPYRVRLVNRVILALLIFFVCVQIGRCLAPESEAAQGDKVEDVSDKEAEKGGDGGNAAKAKEAGSEKPEARNSASGAPTEGDGGNSAEVAVISDSSDSSRTEAPEPIDSTHIKAQKDVFLAEKIDLLLRRFHPDYALYLIVDAPSNEILAWGERKDGKVQSEPDFMPRSTFPAASLIKTVTVAAALESKRYSLSTPIPFIGASHTLYKRQIHPKADYSGPTITLEEAYAKSSNPPMAIVGYNVGAKALRSAAKKLGFNQTFPKGAPSRSDYSPPDTGYGLAEVASGFTQATNISPLLAAAQVRSIVTGKALEIPHAKGLAPYAPESAIELPLEKFSENTYYGLRAAMQKTVTGGTARKNISTKYMARRSYDDLAIGGKTGSLDGDSPAGRYEWFAGFARRKDDPKKAIVIVIMQAHIEIRSQPATQVAAMLINYWARHLRDLEGAKK